MKTISIVNLKGGVGKTSTTLSVAAALAERGKRVLLLDADHQCNLSLHLRANMDGADICAILDGGEPYYAAVRPSGTDSGPDSLNAITNYLENGHAICRPSGRNPRYRPRIKMLYVSGRGFYNAARPSLPHMLQSEVDRWGREVAGRLEGR